MSQTWVKEEQMPISILSWQPCPTDWSVSPKGTLAVAGGRQLLCSGWSSPCERRLCKQRTWQYSVVEEGSLGLLRDPGKLPATLLISTHKGLSLMERVSFHIAVRAQRCGEGHLCLVGWHVYTVVRKSLYPSWRVGKSRKTVAVFLVDGSDMGGMCSVPSIVKA